MGVEEFKDKESREKHLASLPKLSEAEWLDRCAARFRERGGVDSANALEMAKGCLEMRDEFPDDPAGAADEDMSYWNN